MYIFKKRKDTDASPTRFKWIKALTIPIILFLLALIFIIWEAFIPASYFAFGSVSIPEELKKQGITENYIKHEIIKYVKTDRDSATVKINQLFPSENTINDIAENTILNGNILNRDDKIFDDTRFEIGLGNFKFYYGDMVKFLRKKIGKKDIYGDITLIKDKNRLDANLTIRKNQKDAEFKDFSLAYDSSVLSVKDAYNILYKKISVAIEEQYDPIVSILSDYSYAEGYDINDVSWKNRFYAPGEKEEILKRIRTQKSTTYQAKWGNLILATLYQETGFRQQNEVAISECIECYNNALKIDTAHSAIIINNIEQIRNFRQQSFTDNPDDELLQTILQHNKKANLSGQLLICYNQNIKSNEASLIGYEKINNKWIAKFDKISVNVGTKGFAEHKKKTEGDLKAPTGMFEIGDAYGYKNDLTTKLPFITLNKTHIWITDTSSRDYNKLVTYPANNLKYELMIEPNQLNKYGIIIKYNMNPVIKGNGSAITIHVQRKTGFATAGCISMPEMQLKKLIEWLEASKSPYIIMGTIKELKNTRFLN